MSFQLSFAWRRQTASSQKGHVSPVPPAVSASASNETLPSDEESCTQATRDDQENEMVPRTPEGLRPRRSLDTIRAELQLPSHVLQPRTCLPPVLPCLPPCPIPSYSTRSVTIMSPQVTTSSFYSGSRVAESPDLAVGRARTAVGALIGQSQAYSQSFRTGNAIGINRNILPPSHFSVLPPRTWFNGEDERDDNDYDDVDDDELHYEVLNDSLEIVTPSRRRQILRSTSPASTENSSLPASPWQRSWHPPQHQHDVSFSSQVGLVEDKRWAPSSYNFDPIDEEMVHGERDGRQYVVSAEDYDTNVSAISHSTAQHNESIHSLESAQHRYLPQQNHNYNMFYDEEDIEDALMQRKAFNQRRTKEKLMFGVVQRLQHDINLVADVEALHEEADWFVQTPMDREGLLKGYSKPTRVQLTKYLNAILNEMDMARPEEFFLSPSQVDAIADTHDDLRQALTFLQTLVQMAVPDEGIMGKQQWKCKRELRTAMGITGIPESPDTIRGGDTSLFSLPSETTTPHTSNVSVTTTITSVLSPYRASPLRSKLTHGAAQIRNTIEIVATLLQKMTLACDKLVARCKAEDSIRATEEIKRNYLQLMSINTIQLHDVVDAFVVEDSPVGTLARKVSEDEDQLIPIPPRVVRSNGTNESTYLLYSYGGEVKSMSNRNTIHANCMFSPTTEEMQSSVRIEDDEEEYDEDDDLRRQVGSHDYEDGDDTREGPEADERCGDDDYDNLYMRPRGNQFSSETKIAICQK